MDWSLVLASQGIEHTVGSDEATGWSLAVAKADHEKALAQIPPSYPLFLHRSFWIQRLPLLPSHLFLPVFLDSPLLTPSIAAFVMALISM